MQDVDRIYFISLSEMQADDEYDFVAFWKLVRRMLRQGKLLCASRSDITLGNCTVGLDRDRRLGSMSVHRI